MGNLKSFQMRFTALRKQIIADGNSRGLPFHDEDLPYQVERLAKEGTSFVQVTLPLLGRALDHSLVTGILKCPSNFAMKRNTHLPRLYYSVFRRVFDDDGVLQQKPCLKSIYFLRQLLLFDAKLITSPTKKQELLAVQGFKERQRVLRNTRFDPNHPVLLRAQWLLGRVLSRLDLSDILPGHGPGVVAEKKTREERWDFTAWPAKAERYYPYGIYGTQSMRASLERGIGVPLLKKMVTRCCLVPKDFRGPRLISAEPTVNQYLQQGQMKAIMRYVESHKILGRSIRLRDQTHNQRKAREAYADGAVTLDLSDASDTVSTVLVWYLLAKVPKLRRQLMSTRSDFMSFNGDEIKLVAFAPMGSATCFPIESLVFWALSIASLGHVRSLSGFPDELESLVFDVSVFGDDIIVPEDCYSTLSYVLHSVGCKVNMSKTCHLTPFRESCGTEWYDGSDITIIRNRRYHYDDPENISNYPVLLGLQRKFFLCGLYRTAKLCADWAREIYPVLTVPISEYPFPVLGRTSRDSDQVAYHGNLLDNSYGHSRCKLISDGFEGSYGPLLTGESEDSYFQRSGFALDSFPVALGWQFDHCVKLPIRWNKNYQRLEFRVPRSVQSSRTWTSDGYARLFARLSSDLIDRFTIRDRKVKLVWSYLPCSRGFHRMSEKM